MLTHAEPVVCSACLRGGSSVAVSLNTTMRHAELHSEQTDSAR